MNCKFINKQGIINKYIQGCLSSDEKTEFEIHCCDCRVCFEKLEERRILFEFAEEEGFVPRKSQIRRFLNAVRELVTPDILNAVPACGPGLRGSGEMPPLFEVNLTDFSFPVTGLEITDKQTTKAEEITFTIEKDGGFSLEMLEEKSSILLTPVKIFREFFDIEGDLSEDAGNRLEKQLLELFTQVKLETPLLQLIRNESLYIPGRFAQNDESKDVVLKFSGVKPVIDMMVSGDYWIIVLLG